ncbi:hypothetical protein PENTCL1PPCAC_19035, partial [Pristionchus entomophagus]
MAHTGHAKCKFSIGATTFDCGKTKGDEQNINDAIVTKSDDGNLKNLVLEEYTITPKDANDPDAADALRLYEQKDTLALSLSDSTSGTPIKSIREYKLSEVCVPPKDAGNVISKRSVKPKNTGHKFKCDDAMLTTIYLNKDSTGEKEVFCSQRGWRNAD